MLSSTLSLAPEASHFPASPGQGGLPGDQEQGRGSGLQGLAPCWLLVWSTPGRQELPRLLCSPPEDTCLALRVLGIEEPTGPRGQVPRWGLAGT